jgi:2-keto-4-pentenoate hydratase/2-oxohepta-3-ene-1,7-dioic acid hydratase in catechol pathway
MRIARFSHEGGVPQLGLVVHDGIVALRGRLRFEPYGMAQLIEKWQECEAQLAAVQSLGPDYALAEVTLLAPIERPSKILCIGLNYRDHMEEAGMPEPADQLWFLKTPNAITGPSGAIELPAVSDALDYEAELVMIVGKRCRHVSREDAHGVIFGFCVGNDVSVRDWQMKTSQFTLGKIFDTHAPIGPWITTADEVDHQNLKIRLSVNGDMKQDSNSAAMLFDCFDQIAHISKVATLEPGDLIFTGTPAGVAMGGKPPVWLKAGDVVRTEIEGLGAIENEVVAESTI